MRRRVKGQEQGEVTKMERRKEIKESGGGRGVGKSGSYVKSVLSHPPHPTHTPTHNK